MEQLREEIMEREAKPLQSRSAWKESVWMRSWLEADELRRSIVRFPKDQKNFKLLNFYWTNTKNLNLELKANRSEGIENEDDVPTAPPAPVFAGISSVIINSVPVLQESCILPASQQYFLQQTRLGNSLGEAVFP